LKALKCSYKLAGPNGEGRIEKGWIATSREEGVLLKLEYYGKDTKVPISLLYN
jgi:hypothetical protein